MPAPAAMQSLPALSMPLTVAPATEGQYQDVARLYIKPRIGDMRLRDLTPIDVTRNRPKDPWFPDSSP